MKSFVYLKNGNVIELKNFDRISTKRNMANELTEVGWETGKSKQDVLYIRLDEIVAIITEKAEK